MRSMYVYKHPMDKSNCVLGFMSAKDEATFMRFIIKKKQLIFLQQNIFWHNTHNMEQITPHTSLSFALLMNLETDTRITRMSIIHTQAHTKAYPAAWRCCKGPDHTGRCSHHGQSYLGNASGYHACSAPPPQNQPVHNSIWGSQRGLKYETKSIDHSETVVVTHTPSNNFKQ